MANKMNPEDPKKTEFIKLQKTKDGLEPSLTFSDSEIRDNWATQDTIHILRSSLIVLNCDMLDNYSHEVTHGFTMVASEVYLETTRISNSLAMKRKLEKLQLSSVDTGYFNLYLQSELHLSNNTEVKNLLAQKQSVLSAISQSSFTTTNDVRFIDNKSSNTEGYTMSFLNTNKVDIEETIFSGNEQTNINIEAASLGIKNSTFTKGQRSHVAAKFADVRMYGVNFYNSTDETAKGHAVSCISCTNLQIYSSSFDNLSADRGTAIRIKDQMDGNSEIIGCTFTDNKARTRAGAIDLKRAGEVLIKNNTFTRNTVINPAIRYADAGAVYFACEPNSIDS